MKTKLITAALLSCVALAAIAPPTHTANRMATLPKRRRN